MATPPDLQFDQVEWQDLRPKCTACGEVLEGTYFQLAGHNICPNCAEQVRTGQQRPSMTAVLRGALYGLGAAIVGAAGYALFLVLTNIEFAWITIGIGWLIGTAMRQGSGGLGGRRMQVLAVLLAYFAITISSAPVIARQWLQSAQAEAAKNKEKPPREVTPAGYVVVAAIALLSPVLSFLGGGIVSPLLGLFILAVGLYQAWRMTARDARHLAGPFEPDPPPSPVN